MGEETATKAWVRTAQLRDLWDIERIVKASFAPYVEVIGQPPAPMNADYRAAIKTCRTLVIGAQGTDKVAGFAVIEEKSGVFWLETIAVDPAQSGKGLGRSLMIHIENMLAPLCDSYQLYTHVKMTRNIDWYRRMGFVETARERHKGFERVFMRKDLMSQGD